MSEKHFVCIGCPIGCPLQLTHQGGELLEVSGHECNRGAKYAKQEFHDPRRSLTTTVAISGARWARLPVKVQGQVPKERVLEAAKEIHRLHVEAPIQMGDIITKNLLDEPGLHVIATRSLSREGGADGA